MVVVHIAGDVGTIAVAAVDSQAVAHMPGDAGLAEAEVGVARIAGDAGTIAAVVVGVLEVVRMPGDAGMETTCTRNVGTRVGAGTMEKVSATGVGSTMGRQCTAVETIGPKSIPQATIVMELQ